MYVIGWEEKVWIVLAIELIVHDWFFIINQAHFTGSWSITIGDVFPNYVYYIFMLFHVLLVGNRSIA